MDPAESSTQLALILRFIIAILLVVGGIVALGFGYRLYIKGVGIHKDGTTVKYQKISAGLKTVGSVVMATAVAWGGLGYLASPKYSQGKDSRTVASNVGMAQMASAEVSNTLIGVGFFQATNAFSDASNLFSQDESPIRLDNVILATNNNIAELYFYARGTQSKMVVENVVNRSNNIVIKTIKVGLGHIVN